MPKTRVARARCGPGSALSSPRLVCSAESRACRWRSDMGDGLDYRWDDEHAGERETASSKRWRWHLLAFVPSLVLALIVACVPLSQGLYAAHEWSAARQAVD